MVTDVIRNLEKSYDMVSPLTITGGGVNEYLGMTIDFLESGKVKFSCLIYRQDVERTTTEHGRGGGNSGDESPFSGEQWPTASH